ncbi:MAG TPA: hypothetical protein VJ949_14150 [Cryomorphaceae bacterium]|nr:hypothetical protein [Cryomorphaceae bacterium]
MNKIIRNSLAIIMGAFLAGIVNMALILLSPMVVPLPEGVDPMNAESLADNMHRFTAANFIMPFLAHALGTLAGAFIAVKIAATHKTKFAYAVGVLFLIFGIMSVFEIPAPTWFIAVDLIFAYIPMAWLAARTA